MHKEGQTIGTTEEMHHVEVMNIDMAIDIKKGDPALFLNSEVARISVKEKLLTRTQSKQLAVDCQNRHKTEVVRLQSCVKKQAMATGYCRVPAINQIDNL